MRRGCVLAVLLVLIQAAPGWTQNFLYDGFLVSVNPPTDTWEPDHRFWVRAEYLLWQPQSAPLPSLVTNDTRVLYGGDQYYGFVSGVRVDFGLWFDNVNSFGMESSFFQMAGFSKTFNTASTTSILSIPFISTLGSVVSIANPDTSQTGSVQFYNDINFLGGDINFLFTPIHHDLYEINFLFGFQSVFLREDLNGNYNTSIPAISTTANIRDAFGTQNAFYGVDFGVRGILRYDCFSLEATGKLGLGSMLEIVNISGQSIVNGTAVSPPVGLYAQTSNSGHFDRNRFSIVPQAEVRLGWEITSHLKLSLGYDLICMSNVVRPGNQINQTAGVVYNTSSFNTSWFNAQGLNFGIEIRY